MKLEPVANPFPKHCKFEICDLPGQCAAEGKCHHPRSIYAIPAGYVLVPVEPTEAMIEAMVKAVYGPATFKVTPATVEMENMRDAYKAMIEGEQ